MRNSLNKSGKRERSMTMNEALRSMIAAMEGPMTETLRRWIQIPSVKGAPEPGAPFGREVRRALDQALSDGERMGFRVKNLNGYAGDIEMGRGEETIGILCHLDVVPAGDGWDRDPFSAQIVGDRMYGRGASDDKGPAVAALYAMKAVKDAGVPLKKKVRLILGCDEESGWEDMAYYQEHGDMPKTGFSPDAEYPVINTEKGLLHLRVEGPAAGDGLKITAFCAGERPNVVPGSASCEIEGDGETLLRAEAFAAKAGFPLTGRAEAPGRVTLTAQGIPGHAAFPQGARNAIGQLLMTLRSLGAKGAIAALADKVGMEYDGASLGVKVEDQLSGPLTCNLGMIRADEKNVFCTLDIRYPVLADPQAILSSIRAALGKAGLSVTVDTLKAPHHVPEESPLVQALLQSYEEETGLKGRALAIGGGTYARCLKEGVAFCSAFPGDEELAHQAGEYLSIQGLMKNVAIFANAIIRLAGE